MNRVAVVRTDYDDVRAGLKRALDAIGYAPAREVFFIKPNLVRPFAPMRGITTHPALVEAFIALYPRARFIIGDGTPSPDDYARVLRVTGFRALARRHPNVRLVNLDKVERETVERGGRRYRLPKFMRDCEYVNIAKMKTHSQTYVTLSVKNQKGLLSLGDKMKYHKAGLHEAVSHLGEDVRPALNIVDGIVALEGNGPSFFGKARRAGVLVAGLEAFSVDTACCAVMGLDVAKALHLKGGAEYEALADGIGRVRRRFLPPGGKWYIGRIPICFDEHCCSVCLTNLPALRMKFLKSPAKMAKFIYHAIRGDIVLVAAGGEIDNMEGKRIIFLGECGRKRAEEMGLGGSAEVAGGCPFDTDEFMKIF